MLIPLYLAIFGKRRRYYRNFIDEIDLVESFEELSIVEKEINDFVKNRKIKVYHALILRNSIEQKETEMRIYDSNSQGEEE